MDALRASWNTIVSHWGPSLRTFWPRLSKLYSVLGLPLAPRVFGAGVVSTKQNVGDSIPAGAASCVTSLRNPSGLQMQLTTFAAMGPKELINKAPNGPVLVEAGTLLYTPYTAVPRLPIACPS